MNSPKTKLLLKILSGLFVCGCLALSLTFYFMNEQDKSLKVKAIYALHNQFKEGTPSLTFIERARELGAERFLLTATGGQYTEADNDCKRFKEFNAKYKAQLDGSAKASFRSWRPYAAEIYFKQGKVTKMVFLNIVPCPESVVDPRDDVNALLNAEKH
jgi:hypothetical protein